MAYTTLRAVRSSCIIRAALLGVSQTVQPESAAGARLQGRSMGRRKSARFDGKTSKARRRARKRRQANNSGSRSAREANSGAPGRIRTCDLRLRRATLYPAELRVHERGSTRQLGLNRPFGGVFQTVALQKRCGSCGAGPVLPARQKRDQRHGIAVTTHFALRIAPFLQSMRTLRALEKLA